MKLTLAEISSGETRYEVRDPSWCSISELTLGSPLEAEFTLQRRDDQTVILTGQVRVDVKFACDRCGDEYLHHLKTEYYYIFKQGEDDYLRLQEVECNEADCHTVYLKEPVINVSEVLKEQVLLTVPERRVCRESCKGMCPKCGVDLNNEICNCSAENPDSPFAVLKQLKKH